MKVDCNSDTTEMPVCDPDAVWITDAHGNEMSILRSLENAGVLTIACENQWEIIPGKELRTL